METEDAVFLVLGCLIWLAFLGKSLRLACTNWRQLCSVVQGMISELRCCAKERKLQEASFLEAKADALRLRVAHIYFYLLCFVSGPVVAWTAWTQWRGEGATLTQLSHWASLVFFAGSTLHFTSPRVLSVGSASYWYVALMIMTLVSIASAMDELRAREAVTAREIAFTPLFFAFFFRVPGACITGRVWLIVLCNIAISIATNAASPVPAPGLEIFICLFTLVVTLVLNVLFIKAVEREVSHSEAATNLQAATALLQLTCDAVIELDGELRLIQHSDDLAAILLRDRPLTGMRFDEFLAGPEERRQTLQILRRPKTLGSPSSCILAQSFRTRLVDSCSSKFYCEAFHVNYLKPDGKACHLLGLRDVTDQESLARPAELPPPQRSPSKRTSASEPNGEGSSGGSQRVTCLMLDLAAWVVECASLPAESLVGMPLAALFPHTGTELLREVLEAVRRTNPGTAPSLYSFAQVAVQWAPNQLDYIDGTIEILQSRLGEPKLLLRCTGSSATVQPGSGAESSAQAQTAPDQQFANILPGRLQVPEELA